MGKRIWRSRRFGDRLSRSGMKCASLIGFIFAAITGCALSTPPFEQVDLEEPGWRLYSGQALWNPGAESPTLAGDIIVAIHESGNILVNFSKSAIPLITAQIVGDTWRLEVIEGGKSYSGKIPPPKRVFWFFLPDLIEGKEIPKSWMAETTEKGAWTVIKNNADEMIKLVIYD
jgi:hypothetical protein